MATHSSIAWRIPWTEEPDTSTVRPEDDVTTGVKNEKTTLGVEDYVSTPAASKEPLATPRPTGTENVTQSHIEDLPTGESTTAKSTPAQSTPAKTTVHTHVPATSHSQETLMLGKIEGKRRREQERMVHSVVKIIDRKQNGGYQP
ncbi:hypothetical protein FD755_011107 [Muntiacus reevesi]|uniref:Uncharacterized protein n=1 Tax=Muntiacus reevesi TaxID=9886 RepID=A0A5N3XTD0_MUNRE|nr:hypothetical protein FD755_011107 [Muntiacus reevesi]